MSLSRPAFPFHATLLAAFVALVLPAAIASAQYSVQQFASAGNPGGNPDSDTTTVGYTQHVAGPQSVNAWSAPLSIPFAFEFWGQPVTQLLVSNNGLITFDTTATGTPPDVGATLPDARLPNNTICAIWSSFTATPPTGSGDDVDWKVLGTAPDRQLWIKYYSFEVDTATFYYWGCVLEETTNRIWVLDTKYKSGTVNALVGVQRDAANAVMFGTGVMTMPVGGSSNTDNDYYQFDPLLPIEIDVQRPAATSIPVAASDDLGVVPTGTPTTFTYTIENQGVSTPLDLTGTPLVAVSNFTNCTATVTALPTTPIAPLGGATTFDLEVTVTAGAPFSFDVSIDNTDANENPYTFTVTGTGPSPVMDVQRPLGISIPDAGADNLGLVNSGAPTTFTYNILNTGAANLNLTGTPLVAIASMLNCTVTVSLAPTSPVTFPTGSTTFDIDVTPTASGPFSFDISIDNDDPVANPYNYSVSGSAPLSGSFDVGGGALDYADIGAAFDALELLGVGAPVTFNVYDDPGTYTATTSYELNAFTGMGPANQVTVQAAPGENPVLTGAVNIMSSGPDVVIYLEQVSGVSIIGLEFDGQGTDEAAIGWYNSGTIADGHTIERCNIHGFLGSAIGLYDPGSPSEFINCLIANNMIWDCQANSFSTYDDGVLWGRRMGGTRVIHNTFVHGASATGVMFHHEVSGAGTELAEFSNNIFYNATSATFMYSNSGGHPAIADGNIWYLGTGVNFSTAAPNTFAEWQALGLDTNGYETDPLLVDPANGDLHLQNPSPAHDRGVALTPPLTVDFDGDARPAGVADDVGADEEPAPIPPPSMSVERPVGLPLQSGTPDSLGNRSIQADFVLTYTIANAGPGDLVISSAVLGTQVNCTATIQTAPTTLPMPASTSTPLILRVNITATGPFSFDVQIDSNDILNRMFTLVVDGIGIAAPDISVQRPAGAAIALGGLDLVASATPGTPVDLTYTIENLGLAPLNLSGTPLVQVGTTSNATATVTLQPAQATVAVGATATFTVQVTSTAAGWYTVFVSIPNDDPNKDPFTFTILGNAVSVSTGGSSSGDSCCGASRHPAAAEGNVVLTLALLFAGALMISVRRRRTATA